MNPLFGGFMLTLGDAGISIIFALWPVPIEIKMSGGPSASSGQISFLSESAMNIGLLW
jgi:hypothetical protein